MTQSEDRYPDLSALSILLSPTTRFLKNHVKSGHHHPTTHNSLCQLIQPFTMAAAQHHHLIAQSSNGSLFAVQSSNSSSVIRCYDGSVSNGSLKFTLRIPPPPTAGGASSSSSSFGPGDQEATNNDPIRKLVFASPPSSAAGSSSSSSSRFLCALREYTILIFDLERGVVSHTLNVRDDVSSSNNGGKKGRKSSTGGNNDPTKAIVCDAALTDEDDQLCVLVLFPSSSSGEGGGKCRIYQYDLAAAGAGNDSSSGLKRKIKVGSVGGINGEQVPSFGVAVSSSSSSSSLDKKGEQRVIAIRMNDGLRICDYHSGEKLCKSNIPFPEGEKGSMISTLTLSTCSKYLATVTKNQIVIFKLLGNDDDDDDDDGKKKKSVLQMIAQLSCKDDSTISNVELVKKKDGLNVLAFQPVPATASLFSCDDDGSTSSSFDSSLPPQLPKAQLQCDQGTSSNNNIALIHSAFHSRRPHEEILVLFQNISSKGGSNAANLPMQSISYDDTIEGTVTVGTELSAEIVNDANNAKKKRKAASSVALAPGDQGNEASKAVDLTSKKARKEKESDGGGSEEDIDGDFQIDDEEGDQGGEQGQSIAERLALLSSAMAETDDEEEDDGDDEDGKAAAASKKSKFKLKSATSETLTTLLAQALSSNDSVQLNIALQVTDRRLVEGTVRSLQALDAERVESGESTSSTGYMSMLMGHIVRRMARRHSLVVPLGVWVKAILAATSRAATNRALHPNIGDTVEDQIAKEAREIALKLGPLRNFLNERVECFPQLLRLEGRLALLSEQL